MDFCTKHIFYTKGLKTLLENSLDFRKKITLNILKLKVNGAKYINKILINIT